ncbi:MAG TPA: IPT/TIG domain-containing protein [Pyrinomonadaceae bacterium]|nr:IPT/TIG domain-containing protein [Pyrinomonadaceae bacterium]
MSGTIERGSNDDGTAFKPYPPKKASFYQVLALFLYHVALALLLAYAVYNVWPPQPWPKDPGLTATANRAAANSNAVVAAAPPVSASAGDTVEAGTNAYGSDFPPPFWLFGRKFQPSLETRLLLLVLLAGAIGSYVHAASSFVDYLGNRTFISSWAWWYLLRPFIGMMLALLFYFVFRGGFVTAGVNEGGDAAASFINPFGVAALAGLVGMFSKVAADKLNEVFSTLFNPSSGQGDEKRNDKLNAGLIPAVSAITPNTGPTAGGTPVTITGSGFMEGAQVTFGEAAATAVSVSGPTSLTAETPPHPAGTPDVQVTNTNNQSGVLKGGFIYR